MAKERAIYGLVSPLPQEQTDYTKADDTFILSHFEASAISFTAKVHFTINHDYSKVIEMVDPGITFTVLPTGIFFCYVPTTARGKKAYKQVKQGKWRHCSYTHTKRTELDKERMMRIIKDPIASRLSKNIYAVNTTAVFISEFCLTNAPAFPEAFCTVDPNSPLFAQRGVEINEKGQFQLIQEWKGRQSEEVAHALRITSEKNSK